MSPSTHPIAVVGGGITGLTAAYRLSQLGYTVRLFEASGRLGGCIRTERVGEWLVESGPNSLQDNSPELTRLLNELKLVDHVREARPEARNRYLMRGGKVIAAPMSPGGLWSTPLLKFSAKLRLARDLFCRPRTHRRDISVAKFFSRHFGQEAVDYAVAAMVSGIYAGNAEKLSAQHAFPSLWKMEREHGSLLLGLKAAAKAKRAAGGRKGPPRIISFDEGLALLPEALAAALTKGSIELGARVTGITQSKPCQLQWSRDGQSFSGDYGAVVLALPASALARLTIGNAGEHPLARLNGVEYPAVTSLYLGYRRDQVKHPLDGFGLLVPPIERRSVLGVLFSSTLFERRAPDDHVGLTVMVGGALRSELGRMENEQLLGLVRRELADLLGVEGEPVFIRRHTWPEAIPQYNVGYDRFLDTITECETNNPDVFIGGNVRDGVALTACIASGERLAAAVAAV